MPKLFTVVGTSVKNQVQSYRVANSLKRSKVLARNGHTRIELVLLPEPMTKDDAITYFKATKAASGGRDAKGRFTKQAFQFLAA